MEAKKQYDQQLQKINSEIILLKIRLKAHRKKKSEVDFGLVGDLGLVIERLEQINSHLK
jgi:hypothetical protein